MTTEVKAKYPEHDKLTALRGANQTVGDFIGWLEEQGLTLCTYNERHERYYPARKTRDTLIAEFFDIDPNKLEAEKVAMLDAIRAAQK